MVYHLLQGTIFNSNLPLLYKRIISSEFGILSIFSIDTCISVGGLLREAYGNYVNFRQISNTVM